MLLMFAKKELVGHSGDVIANDDVARLGAGAFFVRGGHGARRIQVVHKELLETANGAVAVLSNGGVIIDVLEEKTFQFLVTLGKKIAETGKPARGTADVVH